MNCLNCEKPIPVTFKSRKDRKFCCKPCSNAYNNSLSTKERWKDRKLKSCKWCGITTNYVKEYCNQNHYHHWMNSQDGQRISTAEYEELNRGFAWDEASVTF